MTYSNTPQTSYRALCTEFYDISKPHAGPKEVDFYLKHFKKVQGPILEAMCGSGRLLIPLLRKGVQVDGVDNSTHMLESCSKRCDEEDLEVKLFNQTLENLELPKNYGLIFIAIGSFQLLADRAAAFKVLQNLHNHLLPGGMVLIDTFIPWDSIRDSIDGAAPATPPKTFSSSREVVAPDKSKIILNSSTKTFVSDQLEASRNHYEKYVNNALVATEEEELFVRWYYRYEMELFLEKAGYSSVRLWNESFEHSPHATLYQATRQ